MSRIVFKKNLKLAYERYIYLLRELDYCIKRSNNKELKSIRDILFRKIDISKIKKYIKNKNFFK